MEKIKIENLSFTYPSGVSPALENINLTVHSGDFAVVFGKSGCGKTTLLRRLKPTVAPHGKCKGGVFLDGRDVNTLSPREQAEKIGFVFQNPDDRLVCDKVWHELAFALENLAYSDPEIRSRVAETAAFFGMQGIYNQDVASLSGGQKQLLCLASVMVMRPSVLVLDEPTSRLDPIAANNFLDMLVKINSELGTTVILSEHNLENVLGIADKAIFMDSGRIIAEKSPGEIGKTVHDFNSAMFGAMPTPMRIYYNAGKESSCPLSIKEARQWLVRQQITQSALFSEPACNSSAEINLEVIDAYVRYEKNKPDVLRAFSLAVRKGEFYCILGPNGVGKTTAVSLMCGALKAYRGKVRVANDAKIGVLWQNPTIMFTHKTVLRDLKAIASDIKASENTLEKVIDFCELGDLLFSHPYDLSGGQQQRAALAMVLIAEPNILILDEPTKGLDFEFKEKLADMISNLKASGKTVIIVSHDIEFCAKHCDRCGMLFDGKILSEGTPRKFFGGNSFYTTAANRISRGIADGAVLDTDILSCLGIKVENPSEPSEIEKNGDEKKLMLSAPTCSAKKRSSISVLTAMMFAVLMIATIFCGKYIFGDRKYYFISLLVILEAFVPFALSYERRKPKAAEIVIISVLCALAVAGRAVFASLPQFKPVAALVIISGICLGGETGFLVGAISAFVSNFFFVQGPWTPWQMFAFGIIGFISGAFYGKKITAKKRNIICIFGFFATFFIYGAIMNSASVIMKYPNPNFSLFVAKFASGLPFDLVHALSTAFFLWIAAEPMCEKLERIKTKYGLA